MATRHPDSRDVAPVSDALKEIRNPVVVVAGFAEIDPAFKWVSELDTRERPRVTFLHVIETEVFLRGLGFTNVSAVELIADARRDGERVLRLLRAATPESISVTTRLLEAGQSPAEQILHAAATVPCCDALVICTPCGPNPFSKTARLIRRLRARSSVPVLVLERSRKKS